MTGSILHIFEEIPLRMPNGQTWLASGRIEVEYRRHRGDRSVGEPDAYFEYELPFEPVELSLLHVESDAECVIVLDRDDPILDAFWQSRSDAIQDACHDDYWQEAA